MSSEEVEALREDLALLRFEFEALRLTVDELVQSRAEPLPSAPASSETPASGAVVPTSDKEGRASLARQIGRFLRASYEGRHFGSSGRDRLQLRSRLCVALVDYQGNRFSQPQVYREFSALSAVCKRGPSVGDSVFVGFATEWEAKLALEAGGFAWPSQPSDGY